MFSLQAYYATIRDGQYNGDRDTNEPAAGKSDFPDTLPKSHLFHREDYGTG